MARTKHHQKYGKDYSSKKYFVVPVGMSWWNHAIFIYDNGDKPKIKKNVFNTDNNWHKQTPSWWVALMMTSSKRNKCRNWEKETLKLQDIEDCNVCPDFGNKPHLYYW